MAFCVFTDSKHWMKTWCMAVVSCHIHIHIFLSILYSSLHVSLSLTLMLTLTESHHSSGNIDTIPQYIFHKNLIVMLDRNSSEHYVPNFIALENWQSIKFGNSMVQKIDYNSMWILSTSWRHIWQVAAMIIKIEPISWNLKLPWTAFNI